MKAKIEIELEIKSTSHLCSEKDLLDCIMEDLPEGVQKVIENITISVIKIGFLITKLSPPF